MTSIVSHQTVRLRRGKHASPEKGVCVMELASMLAGEPFSDRPQAVCPVIGAYLRSYNDVVDDERRQDLYRYASEAIGSAGAAALRRRRAERCLEEIALLHDQRSRVRRWLSGRPELSLPGSSIELERVGMHLARALQRSGPEGHARALALADELIAMGPVPAAPEIPRRPPRAPRGPPRGPAAPARAPPPPRPGPPPAAGPRAGGGRAPWPPPGGGRGPAGPPAPRRGRGAAARDVPGAEPSRRAARDPPG